MAFVVIVHLNPDTKSSFPELIQRKTEMKVVSATENMKVEPDRIYVIPSGSEMTFAEGMLHLNQQPPQKRTNVFIDSFFRSLAENHGEKTVGIILSGCGTDGSDGIRAIKAEMGVVFAQDPETADQSGMPDSAIDTGIVDFVLAPELMPKHLLNYWRQRKDTELEQQHALDKNKSESLQKILKFVRGQTNHDFSQYKKNTLYRRVGRRMAVQKMENIKDYVELVKESDKEKAILFKDLLIGVTAFFRDPEVFDLLRDRYLPQLFQDKADDEIFKAWVSGCSSGEEAYSLAIIVHEAMEAANRHFKVQIFATDIDEDAITNARTGIFPESIGADVSADRLNKFFTKEDSCYRVQKNIRDMIMFASQSVTRDPPFTRLDLLSCRNLLIYFNKDLQDKLLPTFHYCLKPGGLLLLGTSETVGRNEELFTSLDSKWKIYQRQNPKTEKPPSWPLSPQASTSDSHGARVPSGTHEKKTRDRFQMIKSMLMHSQLPPSVVVNSQSDIVYVHGHVGRFLELAEGEVRFNIFDMARPGLQGALRQALKEVEAHAKELEVSDLRIKNHHDYIHFNLIIRPLRDTQSNDIMITFEELPQESTKTEDEASSEELDRIRYLEDELHFTRESLQSKTEEMETTREELMSSNEELQSSNEELQSANEELETSKEELQSLNEESTTMNNELQYRIEELSRSHDDMKNLLDSIDVGILFLDIDLKVRRFTSKVKEHIPLTEADIGRALDVFVVYLKEVSLNALAEQVLDSLQPLAKVVENEKGKVYRLKVRPYRTGHHSVDGVVITFEDITELIRSYRAGQRLAAVVEDSNDAVILHTEDGTIKQWNKGAANLYGYSEADALQMNIFDFVPDEHKDEYRHFIAKSSSETQPSFVTERIARDGTKRRVLLTITDIPEDGTSERTIATTEMNLDRLTKEAKSDIQGG